MSDKPAPAINTFACDIPGVFKNAPEVPLLIVKPSWGKNAARCKVFDWTKVRKDK